MSGNMPVPHSSDDGASVDRKTRDFISRPSGMQRFADRLQHRMRGAGAALSSTDGRWAAVSTVTALTVTIAVAWMAMGILPVSRPMVAPGRASLPYALFIKLMHASQPAEPDNSDNANPEPGVESRTVTLDPGDTLVGALEDAGISAQDATGVVSALGKDFNPRSLRAGQTFDLTYSVAKVIDASGGTAAKATGQPRTTVVMVNKKPVVVPVDAEDDTSDSTPEDSQPISRLLSLTFSPTIEQDITVTRTTEGSFSAQTVTKQLEVHRHRAGGTIDSSLYLAAMQAGIPADVVVDMIHIFSYKVDFQRDLQPGDRFEVYYDYYYTPEGQPAKYGSISYAMLELNGKQIPMYRFQPDPNDSPEYFDPKGQSTRGLLMRTPVDGARISSGFGSRFHPVLGYSRMHKGVDFAVPVGTPVMASGSGEVIFMGRARGYGNFMKIRINSEYAIGYAHLSRFAPGLHRGSHVRQGQIVAYSGNTGLTTGPHLHYETFVNNKQVNPLTLKMAQGRQLAGKLLRAFQEQRMKIDGLIATTPLETKVADIATDLRQAKAK
ncbi:MAG: peptidoglycan DD-metalloendopeptidase family protein [Alphaproteobacteria bacterium]|nr:peptidoglycan DD-metalloendopeptidase family protein [Alphaproteobacteria bacterium]